MPSIESVPGFYNIIPLKPLRRTKGVSFDYLDPKTIPGISAIDRVLHHAEAFSPGSVEGVERPWYMHPFQADNLMVLQGKRLVDIYTPAAGKMLTFEVTPDRVEKDGALIFDGPAMLVWPKGVFHRVISGKSGSSSLNFATHYDGFDITTNFNVYDVNTDTGEYRVIRKGETDQF